MRADSAGALSGVHDRWLRQLSSTIVLGFGATYAAVVIAVVRRKTF